MLYLRTKMNKQSRILTYLDGLRERVNKLWLLQAESQVELDALLLSVLDRAFKGELYDGYLQAK